MKNYIKKISYLLLTFTLLLGSCEVEDSLTVTSPDASFTLNTPGISSVFLNFALPNNSAFTINWKDQLSTDAEYTVEMSTDTGFTSPNTLGTTSSNNFSMSVTDFNQAINNAGVTNFNDVAIYMRVKNANSITNSILLLVTTYPVNAPTFNGVEDGDSFVLSLDNNDAIAITVGWNDPILDSSLNIDVNGGALLTPAILGFEFGKREGQKMKNFRSLVNDGKSYDIKRSSYNPNNIGGFSIYSGESFRHDDYGNYMYGVNGKAYGYKLWFLKVGAGLNQIGKGNADWTNIRGFFDHKRDTDLITRGYKRK